MVGTDTSETDMSIGLGVLFVIVAAIGALLMYLSPGDPMAGWGFALTMIAGALAVVAIQLYW